MFQISYFWVPPMTLLFGVVVGILASLIPGKYLGTIAISIRPHVYFISTVPTISANPNSVVSMLQVVTLSTRGNHTCISHLFELPGL